ncbi:dihydroorotase [Actinoalloteichus hoggarensis]|uniref:Dihydroorotase n=1 Tax=Actinoalloteichus hoggarensis TaxID=1470176 RepID=A0A221W8J9_9PSEU|nr:dihydroorotase [Actinoalloteichus hoggarensis]ASO22001.1 Dihydroorotase [Actinoalloteichus hoggarensis]MBB5923919.1 dihydroorotase [Actinoalloteichus hoggarensis]
MTSLRLRRVRPLGGPAVDVEVTSGWITAIGEPATGPPRAGELDGRDAVLLPGLVDLHTHLREPGGEDAETVRSGTASAAAGGFTDVFAMANTTPATDTVDRVRRLADLADDASTRVHPVAAVTVGLAGERLTDLESLRAAGVRMFSDDGRCVDDARLVDQALRLLGPAGGVLAQHAQSEALAGGGQIDASIADALGLTPWPMVAEDVVVARDVLLAMEHDAPLHVCHVSSPGTLAVLDWARRRGARVTAEVTPHHLLLDTAACATGDPSMKVNPPLRPPAVPPLLRQALRDGVIDVVATDHAPHPEHRKRGPWAAAAFGLTGLETALAVVAEVFTDGSTVDWTGVARVLSHRPAVIGDIADRAGRPPAVGEPADFCLVASDTPWEVRADETRSASRNSPFVGRRFTHRVVLTVCSGRVTWSADDPHREVSAVRSGR